VDRIPRAAPWVVAGVSTLAALVTGARVRWRAFASRRRLAKMAARARAGEARAEALLERRGFVVIARQPREEWSVRRGGEIERFTLRADLLVERGGRRFVAEVKTGGEAPSLAARATRRQLLEYYCAFAVDGVLLVDAEAETVEPVTFELPGARPRSRWGFALFLAGILLGAAGVVAGARLLR
jgi:hypothetical protein